MGGGSSSSSKSKQTVWDKQDPYLRDKYSQAYGALQNYDPRAQQETYSNLQNAQVDSGVSDYLRGVMGGQAEQFGVDQGTQQWLESFRNPGIDPAFTAYQDNMNQNFNEQIMPGLRGQDALAGGMGNSRAQIGQALASQRNSQAISDFGAQTYSAGQDRSLNAANALGGLQNQYSQLNNNANQMQTQYGMNAATTLQQAQQNMYGINAQGAQLNQQAPWYGLQQYSGLIGDPTVLTNSSSSTSSGGGIGSALGAAVGIGSMFIPGGQLAGMSLPSLGGATGVANPFMSNANPLGLTAGQGL